MDKVGVLNFTDDDGSTYVVEISTFSDGEADKPPEKPIEAVHRSKDTAFFTCYTCNSPFHSLKGLRVHLKMHCRAKGGRSKHVKLDEGKRSTGCFSCTHCSFASSTKAGIRIHVKNHARGNEMVCSDCGDVFTRRFHLKNHLKEHYKALKTCSHCEFVTWNSAKLQEHAASHGVRYYSCDICDFKCSRKYGFSAHMKTHPKDEPAFDYSRIRSKKIRVYSRTRIKTEIVS